MPNPPSPCFHPNDFSHPEDRSAREQLEGIPGFSSLLKSFLRLYTEQMMHGLNMASKIRLSPKQLPDIYRFLPPICRQLGIDEPEFYLEMDPKPNAYTYGDTRIFITITSGLLQHLEEDEVKAVLAHECGHIVCRHVLYHTMASMLLDNTSGLLGTLSAPIRYALFSTGSAEANFPLTGRRLWLWAEWNLWCVP